MSVSLIQNMSIQNFNLESCFTVTFTTGLGNYPEKCPVRIWKIDIPLLIDLLISNNFSSMTFF